MKIIYVLPALFAATLALAAPQQMADKLSLAADSPIVPREAIPAGDDEEKFYDAKDYLVNHVRIGGNKEDMPKIKANKWHRPPIFEKIGLGKKEDQGKKKEASRSGE